MTYKAIGLSSLLTVLNVKSNTFFNVINLNIYTTIHIALHSYAFNFSLTGREKQVGGFDLMWNDGPVYKDDVSLEALGSNYSIANTHLGNYFNSI